MNTIDLGYVIPGAYSGLSRIRGCSSLCCTDQASVGALETSAPPAGCRSHLRTQKKGLQSRLTLKTSSKEGSHLLSRIALQYHRRKRA